MFVPTIDRRVPLGLLPGIAYGYADGVPLLLDLVLPETPTGASAIWLHGGGWCNGSRVEGISYWCALFAAHGIACAAVDYRLSGDAVFPAQLHDVKAAIRWLRAHAADYELDPHRIGIWGLPPEDIWPHWRHSPPNCPSSKAAAARPPSRAASKPLP